MPEADPPGKGSLQETTATDLLNGLAANRRTGLLRFQGSDPKMVALADGDMYLATSASGPSIHQIVVGSGASPEAAWVDAGPAAAGDGIVAALAGDARVDGERLQAVLREHTVATVVELLAPSSDQFEFLADQVHQLGAHFRFSVSEVLADADHRLSQWRDISGTLPSTATRVRRSPTLPRGTTSADLAAVEWQVVTAMPDEGTVAEVIGGSGLSAFTVFDVLHRLVRRGLVQAVSGDPAAR